MNKAQDTYIEIFFLIQTIDFKFFVDLYIFKVITIKMLVIFFKKTANHEIFKINIKFFFSFFKFKFKFF